ncbi:DUF339-domain-containing protein [Xylariaceae sp. FL1019]|nr:DUF339-domain-containing protein [Xylariaceae sp. FL1019]
MASLRTLLRPARQTLSRCYAAPRASPMITRSMATVGNAPPIEPQRQAGELSVGELEGASFKIEPLRRVGEDEKTMRARLVYQSRKRGTLESDLLLSTFADTYLPTMTLSEMTSYDLFLDENDWDIYYWATQDEPTSSPSTSSTSPNSTTSASYGSGAETAAATESAVSPAPAEDVKTQSYAGEWAQTVGTFKPAYRPVPARWADSEVLRLLREHVKRRAQEKGGMAFMPALKS